MKIMIEQEVAQASQGCISFSTGLGLIGIAKCYVCPMANTWHAQIISFQCCQNIKTFVIQYYVDDTTTNGIAICLNGVQ
jgi:hypothetical protein